LELAIKFDSSSILSFPVVRHERNKLGVSRRIQSKARVEVIPSLSRCRQIEGSHGDALSVSKKGDGRESEPNYYQKTREHHVDADGLLVSDLHEKLFLEQSPEMDPEYARLRVRRDRVVVKRVSQAFTWSILVVDRSSLDFSFFDRFPEVFFFVCIFDSVSDLKEHFLEGGDSHSVRPYAEVLSIFVEIAEELLELLLAGCGKLERHFARNFLHFLDIVNSVHDKLVNLRSGVSGFLGDDQVVADSESVLQEEGASGALYLALCHYSNPVSQDISLVHIVSCQDNDSALFVLFEHFPESPPRCGVHARCRLVKQYNLRVANHCDGYRKLSLLASRESFRQLGLHTGQVDIIEHLGYLLLNLFSGGSFESGEKT